MLAPASIYDRPLVEICMIRLMKYLCFMERLTEKRLRNSPENGTLWALESQEILRTCTEIKRKNSEWSLKPNASIPALNPKL